MNPCQLQVVSRRQGTCCTGVTSTCAWADPAGALPGTCRLCTASLTTWPASLKLWRCLCPLLEAPHHLPALEQYPEASEFTCVYLHLYLAKAVVTLLQETVAALRRYQEEAVSANERERMRERGPILEVLRRELEALEKAADGGWVELVKHIYRCECCVRVGRCSG